MAQRRFGAAAFEDMTRHGLMGDVQAAAGQPGQQPTRRRPVERTAECIVVPQIWRDAPVSVGFFDDLEHQIVSIRPAGQIDFDLPQVPAGLTQNLKP